MKKGFAFSTDANVEGWRVVDYNVMGGVFKSTVAFDTVGNGQVSGQVSVENNGGFASAQLNKIIGLVQKNKIIVVRLKGDAKQYEFRLKRSL